MLSPRCFIGENVYLVLPLFDLQDPGLRNLGLLLGKGQLQNAVIIGSPDVIGIDLRHIEGSLVGAIRPLHADHLAILVLFLGVGVTLGGDHQVVALELQFDILLLKTGQVGFQLVVVALVQHIGFEFGQVGTVKEIREGISEEVFLQLLHFPEGIERAIAIMIAIAKFKHNQYLHAVKI